MKETIGQRELRNDSGAVMRRVEHGESFTVTRNGRPVADLVPHVRPEQRSGRTLAEIRSSFEGLPRIDTERWRAERDAVDRVLGMDDPLDRDAWRAASGAVDE